MTPEEYLQQRADEQINWMEGKSKDNQQRYKFFKVVEIVLAASIPLIVSYPSLAVATGIIGVIIVVLNGMQQLYKYHENWLTYRTTIEALKREKFLFQSQSDPYNDEATAFNRFVQNFEAILANENKKWVDTWRSSPESQPQPEPQPEPDAEPNPQPEPEPPPAEHEDAPAPPNSQ